MAKILRHPSIAPAHPGEILAEITIPATGKSKTEIARSRRLRPAGAQLTRLADAPWW